jgi:hypothetical protein
MDDPDVVIVVHPYADGRTEKPMVRQGLRPERIDFEHRRLDGAALCIDRSLKHHLSDAKNDDERERGCEGIPVAPWLDVLHVPSLRDDAAVAVSVVGVSVLARHSTLARFSLSVTGRPH